jgi:hypothetical protein
VASVFQDAPRGLVEHRPFDRRQPLLGALLRAATALWTHPGTAAAGLTAGRAVTGSAPFVRTLARSPTPRKIATPSDTARNGSVIHRDHRRRSIIIRVVRTDLDEKVSQPAYVAWSRRRWTAVKKAITMPVPTVTASSPLMPHSWGRHQLAVLPPTAKSP